jgi:hypothetical protein
MKSFPSKFAILTFYLRKNQTSSTETQALCIKAPIYTIFDQSLNTFRHYQSKCKVKFEYAIIFTATLTMQVKLA